MALHCSSSWLIRASSSGKLGNSEGAWSEARSLRARLSGRMKHFRLNAILALIACRAASAWLYFASIHCCAKDLPALPCICTDRTRAAPKAPSPSSAATSPPDLAIHAGSVMGHERFTELIGDISFDGAIA